MDEETKNQIKRRLRIMSKRLLRIGIVIPFIVIVILSASVYQIKKHDGTYEEDDWSNTQYAAEQYTNNTSIADDGTITTSMTAQELWDKMMAEHSRVDVYLDEPEELLKLMNAEMVTNYPDLRDNPDEEIDWDNINTTLDSNNVQGIIKFKRAQSNGTTQTMTYVDYGTFFNWVEQYNINGDEATRQNLLTHFTLESSVVRGSTATVELDYSGDNQWTDISEAIVSAAFASYNAQSSPGSGLCQAWVRQVYTAAGLPDVGYEGAYQAFQATCVSTDRNNIPIGAAVYGTGSASYEGGDNIYGHVGIYIGDTDGDGEGEVMDNVGEIKIQSLSSWISWQENDGNTACGGTPGWLGWGWQSGSPTRFLNDDEIEEAEQRIETSAATVVVENTGVESSGETTYYAIVATYSEIEKTITTNDAEVEESTSTTYMATTQKVNFQDLVSAYTMPFDYLWDLLVQSEDKDFVMDLADLVYDSDIEITVHDNLNVHTKEDIYKYTRRERVQTANATVEVQYQRSTSDYAASSGDRGTEQFTRSTFAAEEHDIEPAPCETTVTTITSTNTLDVSLTKADVWIVNYTKEYTYQGTSEGEAQDGGVTNIPNVDYGDYEVVDTDRNGDAAAFASEKETEKRNEGYTNVSSSIVSVRCRVWKGVFDITEQIINTTDTTKYVGSPGVVEEKTDKNATEPNFVTILLDRDNRKAKHNILGAASWLFDILEGNEETADMVDLTKYLLYKASGKDYGVKEFDFSIFYPGTLTSVGEGDYIVHIDKSSKDIVIEDVETLKQAFSGYSGSSELINHAQEFLDLQEEYRVNAVFAAAVSISETSAGREGHAVDGKNNWFNIECTCGGNHGRFETYSSARESIEAFYRQIAVKNYYFTEGNFTVRSIGMIYCENADAPGGWIENTTTFMTQMFNAAGINVTPSSGGLTETGEAIVAAAREKLGCAYVWGDEGPDTFDCSGLTMWCYKQVGISIPHNTEQQKNAATKIVPVSEARVGDVLYKNGHVGIYIGNGQYIHAPQSGDVVKISNNVNTFECALQFY